MFLAGCNPGQTQAERAAAEGILLVGNKVEPTTLDAQINTSVEEMLIETALFEGLVALGPDGFEARPGVAESWEISPDGLTYTFHLRPDARWSDGSPLTSADFLFSWERLLSPGLASSNAPLLHAIRGARAYNEGEVDFAAVAVSAPDAHTLVVGLGRRTPWFLSILLHPATYPVPRAAIEAAGDFDDRSSGWSRRSDLPCNGPFMIADWRPFSLLELRRNPHYWDAASVRLNAVRFFPIESINVEEIAFRGGQLHITDSVPLNRVAGLIAEANPALRVDPYLGVYYYALNTTHAPLDNPDVRMALSLAIDREAIARKLLGGAQLPASSFTPTGLGDYAPPPLVRMDAGEARRLLARAGFPEGRGFPKLELLFNTSENHRMIAEAVQAMWKAQLGIDVDLRNEDLNSYLATRRAGAFDIIRASWVADYPSAMSFLELLRTGGGNNHSRWGDPRYDALIDEALAAGDEEARARAFAQAEALLLESAPVIPIYQYSTVRMVSPLLKGWNPTPMDWHPFKYLHFGS
jgi:oligopeptide transport system substrate-binding protein